MSNAIIVGIYLFIIIVTVTAYIINPRSNIAGGKKHDVYIAGFFPFDENVAEGEIGRGVLPAVRLAVDHINDNPTVLRNYILHLWWNDTKVIHLYYYYYYSKTRFITRPTTTSLFAVAPFSASTFS